MMTIRHWQETDVDQIRPLIREMLAQTYEDGAQLINDEHNVETLLALGLLWSERDEPTFLAEEDGKVIGLVVWGPEPEVSGLVYRPGGLVGIGTVVAKDRRLDGVATRLRSMALLHAKQRGYQRITGAAYSVAGLESTLAMGFEIIGKIVEMRL